MPTAVVALAAGEALGMSVAAGVMGSEIAASTFLFGTALTGEMVASAAVSMLVSSALSGGAEQSPTTSPAFTSQATQRTHIIRSSVANRQIVYGRAMVSGPLVFAASDITNRDLHLVIAIAGHEIDAVEQVYFNDTLSSDSSFAGYETITAHLGASDQLADADLVAAGLGWTADHRLRGVAYLYVKLTYSGDVYPRGIPNIKAVIRGKKLYDPRTTTTVWSPNLALAVRDYLAGSYGLASTSAEIDDTALIAAANICDEAVALAAGGTEARYTCNGVMDTGSTPRAIMEALLSGCGGAVTWPAGRWTLHVGAYESPTVTLDEDDLAGPIQVRARVPRQDLYNAIKGTYVDPAKYWQPGDFPPVTNATYAAQDGSPIPIFRDIALPVTTSSATAQRLARMMVEKSRQGITVQASFKLSAFKLATWENLMLSIASMGWSSKVFKVTGWGFNEAGSINLTLQEEAVACYTWSTSETTVDPAPDTNLPDPFTVAALTGLTLASGTAELFVGGDGTIVPRIKVTWAAATDSFVNPAGRIHAQFKRSTDSVWQDAAQVPGDAVQTHVAAVEDGVNYDVRIRAENSMGVRAATWTTVTGHTVIGKTAKPANVTGLLLNGKTLAWPAVADADLAGYRVRFQYGVNLEWGTANPVHAGLLTESPYVMQIVPPGQVSIMIRAVDTTGNESEASAYVITNFGDTPVANVVESYDFKAATWPGSITGATLSGDNLQADQPDIFYSADASDFYGIDGAPFYSTNYAGLEWISSGWTSSLAAAGSNMTLAWTLIGEAPTLQYRPTGPLPFYADDLSYFYGADADPFYDAPPDWSAWPGSLVADNQEYQWRVSTSSGATSGLLSAFTVSVDVPDKTLLLGGVAIGSGGTRLAGAIGEFNVIQNIQLTLQGGSTAMKVEASDYNNALGPLIDAKNSSGTGVAATIDAFLQGY